MKPRATMCVVAATTGLLLGCGGNGATQPAAGDRGTDLPVASTDLVLGQPLARQFEGLPLNDIAVSPDADRIAANRGDEVCVIPTSPKVLAAEDRCFPFPSGIATGSITWAPDGTRIVFHHDLFRLGQEPDLVELDLASGELTVLSDDGVPIDDDVGETDIAPAFVSDGTLYFFRLDTSDGAKATLHRYVGDGVVTASGPALDGVPGVDGARTAGDSIVTQLSGPDGPVELISVDVDDGSIRSIPIDGLNLKIVDVARDRALLVAPSSVASGRFAPWVADFASGKISPIELPQLGESSMRIVGSGLSPDGAQLALMMADHDDPDVHLLLVADIAADGSVGPLAVLATGPEFVPNDGDLAMEPAGLGRVAEIAWTDTALIYSLGPNEIVTLPLR